MLENFVKEKIKEIENKNGLNLVENKKHPSIYEDKNKGYVVIFFEEISFSGGYTSDDYNFAVIKGFVENIISISSRRR